MAFPRRFLNIKLELAKPNSLKIKALLRETSLICQVRFQICRLALPQDCLWGVSHNPTPHVATGLIVANKKVLDEKIAFGENISKLLEDTNTKEESEF